MAATVIRMADLPAQSSPGSSDRGKEITGLLNMVRQDRSELDATCVEIAERILPRDKYAFFNQGSTTQEGSKRTDKMLDASGAKGLERFGAAMESLLTPRGSLWHRLRSSDPVLNRNLRVQQYFDDIVTILFAQRYSSRAAFATVQQESYISMGAYGTGQYRVEKPREKGERGFRYGSIHLGNIYYIADYQGRIRTALRTFRLSAKEAVNMFAPDGDLSKLPAKIKLEYEKPVGKRSERPDFEFVQAIMPNPLVLPNALDHRAMAFTSEYVSCEGEMLVETGGYRTWPIPINRYVTAPGEVYGRSPGMLTLPAMKTLNEEKRIVLKQGHRAVDPITLVHDDGIMDAADLRPGSIVAGGVSARGERLVQEYGNTGRVDVGMDLMAMERKDIDDIFLVTLFQILTDNPQMTATEVIERVREKGALLAPTAGRQQSECLGTLIERELDLLAEQGLLPQMPPELIEARGQYTVEYEGPLARMQKAEAVAGLTRTISIVLPYVEATQDPTPLLRINMDAAMPDIAWANAVPARWLHDDDTVAQLKQSLGQQNMLQQAVAAAPALSGLVKAAGPTPGAKG
jgi:hypothetical protein